MNGPKGKRGPIASCPMCGEGATGITWDAELDVCTCGNCGWTNGSEILDLYPTPLTNADRIRAMTDEELAHELADIWDCHKCSEHERLDGHPLLREEQCDQKCEQHCLEWLQQPCGGAE